MRTVQVGGGRDVAGVPLPDPVPAGERPPMTALLSPTGDLLVDEATDPVAVELAGLVAEDRAVIAAAARFEARLVAAYLWGAAEYAARRDDPSEQRRREWGARGMVAELAVALRVPEGTLARRLTRITTLAAFPRLHAAHALGGVSSWHVDVVLDVFRGVTDPEVLERADAALVGRATAGTASQLRTAARRWRARHVPATPEQHSRAIADRFVDVTPADDDLCWLTALLPAAQAMAAFHRISDLAEAAGGPDDGRTLPQRRADVLSDLLLDATAATAVGDEPLVAGATAEDAGAIAKAPSHAGSIISDPSNPGRAAHESSPVGLQDEPTGCTDPGLRGIRPEVVLTVPVLTLLGHGDEPAELEGFGPIDLDTARALCAQAPSFLRVLTHPETGTVLSVGRDRYRVPADLRRAVQLRDQTCRFPGCRRRAGRCDLDHSTAWAGGGGTEVGNLASLCRTHHRLKHEAGWRVRQQPDGVLHWTSPAGLRYSTEPATALGPPGRCTGNNRTDDDTAHGSGPARDDARARSSGYPDLPPF